jgi:hypothetical protein
MAYEIIQAGEGVVRVRISGEMCVADLRMLQETCVALMNKGGILKLLIMFENFQGWEHSSAWEQTDFMPDQDKQIQKMAFVGEEQWRDKACAFVGKGLRTFEIEYFLPSALAEAERWLLF